MSSEYHIRRTFLSFVLTHGNALALCTLIRYFNKHISIQCWEKGGNSVSKPEKEIYDTATECQHKEARCQLRWLGLPVGCMISRYGMHLIPDVCGWRGLRILAVVVCWIRNVCG